LILNIKIPTSSFCAKPWGRVAESRVYANRFCNCGHECPCAEWQISKWTWIDL